MDLSPNQIKSALTKAKENLQAQGEPLSQNQIFEIWDCIKAKIPAEPNIPFEEIWDIYKITNRTRKKEAEQYWKKMSDKKRQQARDKVKAFLDFKPFVTYMHPALVVYLRKERWEDVGDPRAQDGISVFSGIKNKYEELI